MDYPSTEGIEHVPEEMRRRIFDELVQLPSRRTPYWVQVMGIPGAGKSELTHFLAEELSFRKPHVFSDGHIQPEADSTAIRLEVHKKLIAQKSDILFEDSLLEDTYCTVLYFAKKAGYTLIVLHVTTLPEVANARTGHADAVTRIPLVQEHWLEMKRIADYTVEVANNGEVSAYDAFKGTVGLVADYVRGLDASKV